MRKQLSIFFAAVLVCMVHTNAYCATHGIYGTCLQGQTYTTDPQNVSVQPYHVEGASNKVNCSTIPYYYEFYYDYADIYSCTHGTGTPIYLHFADCTSCVHSDISPVETEAEICGCKVVYSTCPQCTQHKHCSGRWESDGANSQYRQKFRVEECQLSSGGAIYNRCDYTGEVKYKCMDGYHGMIGDTEWTPTEDGTTDSSLTCHQCTNDNHCDEDTPWGFVPGSNVLETRTTYVCDTDVSYTCISKQEFQCTTGYHDDGTGTGENMNCVANACSGDGDCDPGLHCNTATGACISGCVTDVHCSGSTPVCNTSDNTCVQCTGDEHCPDSGWVSNDSNRQSYTTNVCSNNSCTASGTEYRCINDYVPKDSEHTSDSLLVCVQCTENGHCTGDTPVCRNNVCIGGCLTNDDCSDPTPKCNTDINQCVECLEASDCGSDLKVHYSCTNNQCDCKCEKNHYLFSGSGCEIYCQKCPPKSYIISPQPGSILGQTDGPNTAGMEACYISYDGTIEDDTGWFTITDKCGWKEE